MSHKSTNEGRIGFAYRMDGKKKEGGGAGVDIDLKKNQLVQSHATSNSILV